MPGALEIALPQREQPLQLQGRGPERLVLGEERLELLPQRRWIAGVQARGDGKHLGQVLEGSAGRAVGRQIVVDLDRPGLVAGRLFQRRLFQEGQEMVAAALGGDIGHRRRGGAKVLLDHEIDGLGIGAARRQTLALAIVLPAAEGRHAQHRGNGEGDDVFPVAAPGRDQPVATKLFIYFAKNISHDGPRRLGSGLT